MDLETGTVFLLLGGYLVALVVYWIALEVLEPKRRLVYRWAPPAGILVEGVRRFLGSRHPEELLTNLCVILNVAAVAFMSLSLYVRSGRDKSERRSTGWIAGRGPLWLGGFHALGVALVIFGPGVLEDRRRDKEAAIEERCREAARLGTLAERRQVITPALSELGSGGGRFHACRELARELDELESKGLCPESLIADRHCLCGSMRWPEDAPCVESECGRDLPEGYVSKPHEYPQILKCKHGSQPTPHAVQEELQGGWVPKCWLWQGIEAPFAPCRMHADLDGDGHRDRVLLVVRRSDEQRALAIFFSSAGRPEVFVDAKDLDALFGWRPSKDGRAIELIGEGKRLLGTIDRPKTALRYTPASSQ